MIVLGIETSCDETAVAVVKDGVQLLSNVVATSLDLHTIYGGVVPEIAARSHIESMVPVVDEALVQAFGLKGAGVRVQGSETREKEPRSDPAHPSPVTPPSSSDSWDQVDAIAVTHGAGLGGSLLVGVMTARTLAIVKNKPLYAINHVEAHVYANFITGIGPNGEKTGELGGKTYQARQKAPEFPLLALIVSGGHSQLVLFKNHFDYHVLGRTRDDAVGEAFDKVAKVIGLPYPGGPHIAKAAEHGDSFKYDFPKAKLSYKKESIGNSTRRVPGSAWKQASVASGAGYDFSFSGVKTAVLRLAQKEIGQDFTFPSFNIAERLTEQQRNDIAASFQRVAIETLVDNTVLAYEEYQPKSFVTAGGVAANTELRKQLNERMPANIAYPDIKLCTDNGAMIASLGCFKAMHNQPTADPYSLDIDPNLSM